MAKSLSVELRRRVVDAIEHGNPIEMAFSKFKALLRAAVARTIPDSWATIRIVLDAFTPSECQNYFAAAGYDAF
jgi:hypothetical protein